MSDPVIITGMHRSATSLVASMFQRAGLHLGERLHPPGPANRPGYFEDRDFIEFHEGLLTDLGTSLYLHVEPHGEIGPRHRERAEALIAERRKRPAWGWKDPRTCLFLNFWRSLVPDARFVFVYRQPAEVLDSLDRRNDAMLHRNYLGLARVVRRGLPRFRIARGLHMWIHYNERIAAFVEAHPEQCRIVHAENLVVEGPMLIDEMRAEGVPLLAEADVAGVIQSNLLRHRPSRSIERYCRRRSEEIGGLMERLDALCRSTPIVSPGAGDGGA